MAKKPAPVLPVDGRGVDEEGNVQRFSVREVKGGFVLHDPVRKIRTYDFLNKNVDKDKAPKVPIRVADPAANFALASTPGVSAHLNVTRVFQFYNDVLIRRGVDDKGSYLDNIVNCISPEDEPPPPWGNAIWWKNKMWYGQMVDGARQAAEPCANLDVIGHELTHGVTETTSEPRLSRRSRRAERIVQRHLRRDHQQLDRSDAGVRPWQVGLGDRQRAWRRAATRCAT